MQASKYNQHIMSLNDEKSDMERHREEERQFYASEIQKI
jgi:hypothetical protein